MSDLYNTRIKLKRDTEANWLSADPVLLDGEVAIVKCDNGVVRKKIGDGTKKFSELSYDGIQSDWAQNDPDGDGYVANRPGGYMTDPVITDADTFTITSAEGEDGMYMAMVAVESSDITPSDYAIGDGVIVDFGGQSYSLTWQSAGGVPVCGAAVTDGGPVWSSVPFCIMAVFGEKGSLQGYYIYLQNAITSPIQVQIKKAKQTPIRIPMKYIESDVYIVKVTGKSNEQRPGDNGADVSYDVEVSATYADIVAAVNAGKMPILLGGTALSDTVLRLVDINTDTVDGRTPDLMFGGVHFFNQSDRLYGTCVVIDSTGEATCRMYDSTFVERSKGVDDAMSDTSFNPVRNSVIKKYVDDHIAGSLPLGLTSAAVGQIAKIIAVDASGVPTKWAPVNMPVVPTADIDANTSARHSHANKAAIDGVTVEKIATWDTKAGTAEATASAKGLMSAADKAKLDGIEPGANKTTIPTALKNPNALTIKIGSTTVTYDGSTAETVTIADGSEVAY